MTDRYIHSPPNKMVGRLNYRTQLFQLPYLGGTVYPGYRIREGPRCCERSDEHQRGHVDVGDPAEIEFQLSHKNPLYSLKPIHREFLIEL